MSKNHQPQTLRQPLNQQLLMETTQMGRNQLLRRIQSLQQSLQQLESQTLAQSLEQLESLPAFLLNQQLNRQKT